MATSLEGASTGDLLWSQDQLESVLPLTTGSSSSPWARGFLPDHVLESREDAIEIDGTVAVRSNVSLCAVDDLSFDDRIQGTSDSTDRPAIGPLIPQKQTKTVRKRTCRLKCLELGEEQTSFVRGCQDRS